MITATDYVSIEKMLSEFFNGMNQIVSLDMVDYTELKQGASRAVSVLSSSADGDASADEALDKALESLSCQGAKSVMISLCAHNTDIITQSAIARLIEATYKHVGQVPVIWGAGENTTMGEGEWQLLCVVFYE